MEETKETRNKTIRLSKEEERSYLDRCITLETEVCDIGTVLDTTVVGDMLKVSPLLPRECVDLLIADPPYNLTKAFHGQTFKKRSQEAYEAYTRRWLSAVCPLLKKDASIYVCCDFQSSLIIGRVLGDFFKVRNRITWQREKGRGARANWKNALEDIWFATKSDDYTFHLDKVKLRRRVMAPYKADGKPKDWQKTNEGAFRDTCPSNFFDDITVPFWSMKENTPHPTQKPEKLIAKLMLASSDEGDLVFDPFLGSGTTSVVAKKTGRHYLGIEREEAYCALAQKRLDRAASDRTIQGYADGVFWERNSYASQTYASRKRGL